VLGQARKRAPAARIKSGNLPGLAHGVSEAIDRQHAVLAAVEVDRVPDAGTGAPPSRPRDRHKPITAWTPNPGGLPLSWDVLITL
jgi:hypothetical protein